MNSTFKDVHNLKKPSNSYDLIEFKAKLQKTIAISKTYFWTTDITSANPPAHHKVSPWACQALLFVLKSIEEIFFKHISSPVVNRLASFRASFYFLAFVGVIMVKWNYLPQLENHFSDGSVKLWFLTLCLGSAREDFHLAIESYVNSVLIALREFSDKKGKQNTTLAAYGKGQAHRPHVCATDLSECDFILRENVSLPSQHACKV